MMLRCSADDSTGGSIDGQIRAAEENLAKVTDKMLVIPGHGGVGGQGGLGFVQRRVGRYPRQSRRS